MSQCNLLSDDVARAQALSRERAARVVTGPGEPVRGKLSKEIIRQTIEGHIEEVGACYSEALEAWPELHGRVEVKFVIRPDGSVLDAVPVSDSSGVPALGCCIALVTTAWKFPPPEGGAVIVRYPYTFKLR